VHHLRWRYAAGVDDEQPSFVHTVLVELRRVLDSAPLFDAVATQDTVTLLRGAIRGLPRVTPAELASLARVALARDDDYAAAGKPAATGRMRPPASSWWIGAAWHRRDDQGGRAYCPGGPLHQAAVPHRSGSGQGHLPGPTRMTRASRNCSGPRHHERTA
jgi:hypothetical protein